MKHRGSNHRTAAAWNRGLTVRLLRQHGCLSRNDISRMTGLQGSTLSYIMRELLDKRIVIVGGKRESTQVGPKQVLLRLNPDFGWVLGVALRPGQAVLELMDAAGGHVDGTQVPLRGPLEGVPGQLAEILARWTKRVRPPAGEMLALAVGVPGVVDADAGVVLRSIPFGAVNVPLRQLLAERFPVPVHVDHDACYGARAEAADGAAADASHFVYYSINTTDTGGRQRLDAYGSALYLDGRAYRGAFYGAGELDPTLEPAAAEVSDAELGMLADADGSMPPPLLELAARIGRSLAAVINLLDVQMAILAGNVRISNRRFILAVQAEVTQRLIAIPGRAVRVVRSKWEPTSKARGAAIAALDVLIQEGRLFDDEVAGRKGWQLPAHTKAAGQAVNRP